MVERGRGGPILLQGFRGGGESERGCGGDPTEKEKKKKKGVEKVTFDSGKGGGGMNK